MMLLNTLAEIIADGGRLVELGEFERRIRVCESCPEGKQEPLGIVCGKCGCLMNLKAKFLASRCPISHDWKT